MKRLAMMVAGLALLATMPRAQGQVIRNDHNGKLKYFQQATRGSFDFQAWSYDANMTTKKTLSVRGQIIIGTDPQGVPGANLWLSIGECDGWPALPCSKYLWIDVTVPPQLVITRQDSISVSIPDVSAFVTENDGWVVYGFTGPIAVDFTVVRTNGGTHDAGTDTDVRREIHTDGSTKVVRNTYKYMDFPGKLTGEVAGYTLPQSESGWSRIEANSASFFTDTFRHLEIPQ